ncbi:MAG: Rid family detoxifying hydrolase [Gemmatimonadota bacterium]|nr:Rid family detoxifying hydrolase [Gemmatimonadota bacterium]MDH3367635.1 Rid family detoxifying hydrolase [Gemmatimonadota bacterium]MDH3478420.1 Rid family detoxifying hydrolase [Gemmatimonadota bacterium]MDH5549382.1 Rid family detoxifying hydrolase [Gemmatimonadota bacterium]
MTRGRRLPPSMLARRAALMSVITFALIATACTQEKQTIQLPGSLEGLPFSSAVRVGDMLYLSGQIGVLPGTRDLAPGGTAAETRQTMENIRAVLDHAGSSMDRVVKCTVFLLDMADYQAMNEVYREFFPRDPPARSALAASALALGARVEIECMALIE